MSLLIIIVAKMSSVHGLNCDSDFKSYNSLMNETHLLKIMIKCQRICTAKTLICIFYSRHLIKEFIDKTFLAHALLFCINPIFTVHVMSLHDVI